MKPIVKISLVFFIVFFNSYVFAVDLDSIEKSFALFTNDDNKSTYDHNKPLNQMLELCTGKADGTALIPVHIKCEKNENNKGRIQGIVSCMNVELEKQEQEAWGDESGEFQYYTISISAPEEEAKKTTKQLDNPLYKQLSAIADELEKCDKKIKDVYDFFNKKGMEDTLFSVDNASPKEWLIVKNFYKKVKDKKYTTRLQNLNKGEADNNYARLKAYSDKFEDFLKDFKGVNVNDKNFIDNIGETLKLKDKITKAEENCRAMDSWQKSKECNPNMRDCFPQYNTENCIENLQASIDKIKKKCVKECNTSDFKKCEKESGSYKLFEQKFLICFAVPSFFNEKAFAYHLETYNKSKSKSKNRTCHSYIEEIKKVDKEVVFHIKQPSTQCKAKAVGDKPEDQQTEHGRDSNAPQIMIPVMVIGASSNSDPQGSASATNNSSDPTVADDLEGSSEEIAETEKPNPPSSSSGPQSRWGSRNPPPSSPSCPANEKIVTSKGYWTCAPSKQEDSGVNSKNNDSDNANKSAEEGGDNKNKEESSTQPQPWWAKSFLSPSINTKKASDSEDSSDPITAVNPEASVNVDNNLNSFVGGGDSFTANNSENVNSKNPNSKNPNSKNPNSKNPNSKNPKKAQSKKTNKKKPFIVQSPNSANSRPTATSTNSPSSLFSPSGVTNSRYQKRNKNSGNSSHLAGGNTNTSYRNESYRSAGTGSTSFNGDSDYNYNDSYRPYYSNEDPEGDRKRNRNSRTVAQVDGNLEGADTQWPKALSVNNKEINLLDRQIELFQNFCEYNNCNW